MIRLTAQTERARAMCQRLANQISPENLDPIVEKVALQTLASLVQASPKRWFGSIRSGWTITTPVLGSRKIDIPEGRTSPSGTSVRQIAGFVNFGTARNGAGFIYPVKAERLYVPLTRRAAAGWHRGLKWGRDYILKLRVRGIKGQHFIEPERAKAFERLRKALVQMVRNAARGSRG
jgi:hypothetical protein